MAQRQYGQVLVIFAVALVALLLFVGLAVDSGVLYVTYGQLKRASDAAAVAAANNFKRGQTELEMKAAAMEIYRLHNVDTSTLDLNVQICDDDGDGFTDGTYKSGSDVLFDAGLLDSDEQKVANFFEKICPRTDPTVSAGQQTASPRKLVYVSATQRANFYFLSLLGITHANLRTYSVGEAASVDLVIVIDTSESMASECQSYDANGVCAFFKSPGYNNTTLDDYDPYAPGNCNTIPTTYAGITVQNSCYPLVQAEVSAISLVRTLYEGYDNVGLVTYDSVAVDRMGGLVNMINRVAIENAIANVKVHDDAPYGRLWPTWRVPGRFNPINPEDRDGDGLDIDTPARMGYTCLLDADRWDESIDPYGWGGVPCDDNNLFDAFNWVDENTDGDNNPDSNPEFTIADHNFASNWLASRDPDGAGPLTATLSVTSTCNGCGIRTASNLLRQFGRPGSVWVMVYLTDGVANMSDTPRTDNSIPSGYPNGFCQGSLNPSNPGFWPPLCVDRNISPRYCIDTNPNTCPPGSVHVNIPDPRYSAADYARDMADAAALTINQSSNPLDHRYNPNEPIGNDIAIYTIGLGAVTPNNPPAWLDTGEKILRYMAAVGDDGDRVSDPCASVGPKRSCGNYYYAPSGDALRAIFDDIASRIYTRISH